MTYKYYSIMRPVGLGTIPTNKKPVKVTNYPEGKKIITAEDGRKIWAWGEVEYNEPLTEYEMYRYELKGGTEYPKFKHCGYWMGNPSCEIIGINGHYYVLNGWNGIEYGHCWECLTKTKMLDSDKEYTLTPVYRFNTEAGVAMMNEMENETTDKWDEKIEYLNEIISYRITEN